MTKHFLLPLVVLVSTSFIALGQTCIPDTTLPDSIPVFPLPYTADNPLNGIQDTACIDNYFETVVQINLPETIPILGQDQALTSATVATEGGITNIPASFSYACNPPNCVFLTDTVGCIVIYGTAEDGEEGQYDLEITTTLLIANVIPVVRTLPDPELAAGNYFLNVKSPTTSTHCEATATEKVLENGFDLKIQPNPLSDFAEIFVNLPQSDNYTFTVYNTLGRAVQQQDMPLQAGENYLHFDGSNLAVGMYVFTLQNGTQAASGRLLIQR